MLDGVTVSTPAPNAPSRTSRFLTLAALCAVGILVLYVLGPESSTFSAPDPLRSLADRVVGQVDVTVVLVATTAIAIVSMIRNLHYGIGAVLLLGVGANLTSASLGSWLVGTSASELPNGHVVAAAALYGSAVLISAPRWRPAVTGLGISAVAGVAFSVCAAGTSGVVGVIGGLLVASVWGCVAAMVMERSPVAEQREALRPDTAVVAFSRHRSIQL